MESIKKLRGIAERLSNCSGTGYTNGAKKVVEIADEIEREISDRYMPLPLDADGVPIKVGDIIDGEHVRSGHYHRFDTGGVVGVGAGTFFVVVQGFPFTYPAKEFRHVKHRTLEDVLQCAGVSIAAIEDVAAEIREIMEAGE